MNKLQLAGCILKNSSGEVLLIHRNTPNRKQYETPGGKVEPGETFEQTAIREVKEELGVDVEIICEAGRHEFHEDEFDMDYVWYWAKISNGIPKLMETKFDKMEYFSWSRLKSIKSELSPNAHNLVDAYFASELVHPK